MKWSECKKFIKEDYLRPNISKGKPFCLKNVLFALVSQESFMVTFWLRIVYYFAHCESKFLGLRKILLSFAIHKYKKNQRKTGIQIGWGLNPGGGLEFCHYSCIVIAGAVKIGSNASIHQGVTIGRVFAGKKAGVPTLGDNVVIFAGAKILGNIHIGNNCVIGANAVVTTDVPENSVVAGVPAKIISSDSSKCFDETWAKVFNY